MHLNRSQLLFPGPGYRVARSRSLHPDLSVLGLCCRTSFVPIKMAFAGVPVRLEAKRILPPLVLFPPSTNDVTTTFASSFSSIAANFFSWSPLAVYFSLKSSLAASLSPQFLSLAVFLLFQSLSLAVYESQFSVSSSSLVKSGLMYRSNHARLMPSQWSHSSLPSSDTYCFPSERLENIHLIPSTCWSLVFPSFCATWLWLTTHSPPSLIQLPSSLSLTAVPFKPPISPEKMDENPRSNPASKKNPSRYPLYPPTNYFTLTTLPHCSFATRGRTQGIWHYTHWFLYSLFIFGHSAIVCLLIFLPISLSLFLFLEMCLGYLCFFFLCLGSCFVVWIKAENGVESVSIGSLVSRPYTMSYTRHQCYRLCSHVSKSEMRETLVSC